VIEDTARLYLAEHGSEAIERLVAESRDAEGVRLTPLPLIVPTEV
jgi:hypothetical protein